MTMVMTRPLEIFAVLVSEANRKVEDEGSSRTRVTDGFDTDDGGIRAAEMESAPAVGIFPSGTLATASRSW